MANFLYNNPATNERQPYQTELMWIEGSPEGIEFAPAGCIRIDASQGFIYRKASTVDLNVGWQILSGGGMGGGVIVGVGPPPPGDYPDGSLYIDRTTNLTYWYNAIDMQWESLSAPRIGDGPPTGTAPDGWQYINRLNANLWYYDASSARWVQISAGP